VAEPTVPKEELRAAIEARRELGADLEPQVVDAFLERIERRLDERVRDRMPAKQRSEHELALAIVSLGVSIPLIAIAGGTAGLAGVIAVCLALVLLNYFFRRR
jgi:hypothetical protein